jgi:hypothetical protein
MKYHRWPINTTVMVPDHSKTPGIIADQLESGRYGIHLYNGPYIVTSEECFTVLDVPENKDKIGSKFYYIPMHKLVDTASYIIHARNAEVGIWIYKEGGFLIRREKMGAIFLFVEYHWDMPTFPTARPIQLIEMSPFKEQYLKSQDLILEDGTQTFGYYHNGMILEYLQRLEEKYAKGRNQTISKK